MVAVEANQMVGTSSVRLKNIQYVFSAHNTLKYKQYLRSCIR